MTSKFTALVPFVLASVVACSSDNNTTTSTPDGSQPTAVNDDLSLISADAAAVSAARSMDVTLGTDDVSMLVQLAVANDDGLLVTEIRDPNDAVIYSATLDPETGEPGAVVSDYFDSPQSTSIFLPPTPQLVLIPGTYRISFVTEDDSAVTRAEAYIKSSTGNIDQESFQTELNLWIAHSDASFNGDAFEQTIQTTFKDSINTILSPHSLQLFTVNVFRATSEEVAQFATINAEDDEQTAAACRAMQAVTTNKLALNLIYAQELSSEDGGGPAGFSPSPGIIRNDLEAQGCFFVGQTAYEANPEFGFTQSLVDQMMAGNILHEAGHFMSLQHPTEEAGNDFDQLLDTPECDAETYDGRNDPIFGVPGELDGVVTDYECGPDGGAMNVLFYSGVPGFLPFSMSADQAKVLRRHPLFVRVR